MWGIEHIGPTCVFNKQMFLKNREDWIHTTQMSHKMHLDTH